MKKFDLNIEKVLEGWEIYHALREIIANALDEQILTNTKEIELSKDKEGNWRIRDFGRCLRYEHFTQNENKEKLANTDKVIGKFGVGLKDALAVFDRHNIIVKINSKYGNITLGYAPKEDFPDVKTLHAFFSEPSDKSFIGTNFVFEGVKDKEIDLAKEFFLKFSDERLLEETKYGQVLQRGKNNAKIYITGLRVAEEDNFLFSYNITSLTTPMRKALNRERTNVGRTAYAERVQSILLGCKKKEVAKLLIDDLKQYDFGVSHEELKRIEVQIHASKLLNAENKVMFVTSADLQNAPDTVDHAKSDGHELIIIPETLREKIRGLTDYKGNPIRDLEEYKTEWNKSFEFKFVKEKDLTKSEKDIFSKTDDILKLIGGKPKNVKQILISETMRLETMGYKEAVGLWEEHNQRIIIKREQLKKMGLYAATLLHETAHAISGASDITKEFEDELTSFLGIISEKNWSD